MNWTLILGASSDIAMATARKFAQEGNNLYLASLEGKAMQDFAKDLEMRYNIQAKVYKFDALDFKSHDKFYQTFTEKPICVINVFGYLGDEEKAKKDFKEAEKIFDINFTGAASILNIIANDFENRKQGSIIGISSVAGDRGRQSNYLYGSAKGAFSIYLSGLRNRLAKSKVHVLTVKPGFVNTKMTAGMDLPKKLMAEPEEVAADIYKAWKKKKSVIYTKWFWKFIMLIIIHIPEKIFKKLSL